MLVQRYSAVLAVLLLFWSGSFAQIQAQSGYNYVRPDLATTGGGGVPVNRLPPNTYSTGSALPLTPAPATAYGAGLFPSPAIGYTPSGQATTAFGAPAANNLPRRPTATGLQATGLQATSSPSRSGPYGPQYNNAAVSTSSSRASNSDDYNDGAAGDYSAIPGVAGVDYPVYAQVPRTNFDCSQQPLPGYYADIEAQCQVFHICALNRTYSFLCPNGTVFSQETLVCVWWNQYDCVSAPSLYANNAYIYDYTIGNSNANNVNLNANNYRAGSQTAINTAYGAVAPSSSPGGTLRATGIPQVGGYNTARGSYPAPTPTPAQSQSIYGGGGIVRPTGVSNNVVDSGPNRLAPATAAAGLAATAAGILPDNAVGSFAQPILTVGNREYLPPGGAAQRQRGNTI